MPASFASNSFTPDRLVLDGVELVSRPITLLSGENRARGAVLGKQTASTVPTTGTADGGNTGDGTMASVTGGTKAQAGTYTLRNVKVVANAGDFEILAPDGTIVGIATVAVAFVSDHLNLTIADGATDFALGDKFTVAVTGSGKYKLAALASIDGSAIPDCVLGEATDASAADVATVAYFRGKLNQNELVFGTGVTIANSKEGLRDRGIWLEDSIQN